VPGIGRVREAVVAALDDRRRHLRDPVDRRGLPDEPGRGGSSAVRQSPSDTGLFGLGRSTAANAGKTRMVRGDNLPPALADPWDRLGCDPTAQSNAIDAVVAGRGREFSPTVRSATRAERAREPGPGAILEAYDGATRSRSKGRRPHRYASADPRVRWDRRRSALIATLRGERSSSDTTD